MQTTQETLKNRFVSVQLTLLSIAVALILESLLSVMLELPTWSALVAMQAVEIAVSAISMWVGFALGISFANKPPHLMDFLVHFLLLFTLSTAVYCISNGNLPGYFWASAGGSLSAATCLWLDHRIARRKGEVGPVVTARLLATVAILELSLGILAYFTPIKALPWAGALLLPVIMLQCWAAYRSMRGWQQSLMPASA